MKRVHWKCFFLFLSIISVMNSSVFTVRSLLAVAICSNFSSARRIGKQLPAVPTSVMPGRQPGARELHYLHLSPSSPTHTGSVCHLLNKALLLVAWDTHHPAWGLLRSSVAASPGRAPKREGCIFPPPIYRHGRIVPQYALLERHGLTEAVRSYSLNLLSIGRFRPKVVVN